MSLLGVRQLRMERGSRCLCADFSADFEAGQCWALLGPNGAGKTSLLHTLAGLLAPAAGSVLLQGRPLATYGARARARYLGILLQQTDWTFPLSVREAAAQGRFPHLAPWQRESVADWRRVDEALAALDLAEMAERCQLTLSGGERQRLQLATLRVQSPQVWLLDEPGNHLDLHHQIQVLDWLRNQAREQGALVILSLHDPNLAARFCDRAMLIDGSGELVEGAASELLVPERLSELYRHPLESMEHRGRRVFVPT